MPCRLLIFCLSSSAILVLNWIWYWSHRAVGSKSDCRSRRCESIPDGSHTFPEIDLEIVSTVILLLPLIQDKRKYMHEVLVNRLVKLAQEKVWLEVN